MKKIFLLLLACTLLAACDNDDDSKVTPEKPYFNPIEGKWAIDSVNDPERIVRVFSKDFTFYTYQFSNNKLIKKEYRGKYTVTENNIYIGDVSADYKIVDDTLFMIFPDQTQKWIKTDEVLPE